MNIDDLPMTVSWFETAMPIGEAALGDPEPTTWGAFASVSAYRREGSKDGPGFVPSRFTLEPDGRHIRRLKANLVSRTAIALDIETHKKTGEVPPPIREAIRRVQSIGLASIGYTSHSRTIGDDRYRLVFPLSAEIPHDLPAPEIIAQALNLDGVLDRSKINAAGFFYLPSCPYNCLDLHETIVTAGAPIDAAWVTGQSEALLAARKAEADRIAEEAHRAAAERREARIAAGFNPDDSLIEKLRSRFDLADVLHSHGYDEEGTKYRHPNSSSGSYGADIKNFGGIPRVFSHNGTDPLHADNLPDWCGGVTALDVIDVVTILDFGGDRTKALRDLAQRFGLTKATERKAIAGLLFRLLKRQASQADLEREALSEGTRLGLSAADVCAVAQWVAAQATREVA